MFLFYYILVFVCRNRFLLATVKIRNIQKTYKHTHTLTYVAKNREISTEGNLLTQLTLKFLLYTRVLYSKTVVKVIFTISLEMNLYII